MRKLPREITPIQVPLLLSMVINDGNANYDQVDDHENTDMNNNDYAYFRTSTLFHPRSSLFISFHLSRFHIETQTFCGRLPTFGTASHRGTHSCETTDYDNNNYYNDIDNDDDE